MLFLLVIAGKYLTTHFISFGDGVVTAISGAFSDYLFHHLFIMSDIQIDKLFELHVVYKQKGIICTLFAQLPRKQLLIMYLL